MAKVIQNTVDNGSGTNSQNQIAAVIAEEAKKAREDAAKKKLADQLQGASEEPTYTSSPNGNGDNVPKNDTSKTDSETQNNDELTVPQTDRDEREVTAGANKIEQNKSATTTPTTNTSTTTTATPTTSDVAAYLKAANAGLDSSASSISDAINNGYASIADQLKAASEAAIAAQTLELQDTYNESASQYDTQAAYQEYLKNQNRDNLILANTAAGNLGGIGQAQYSAQDAAYDSQILEIHLNQINLKAQLESDIAKLQAEGQYELANELAELGQAQLNALIEQENNLQTMKYKYASDIDSLEANAQENSYSQALAMLQEGYANESIASALGLSLADAQSIASNYATAKALENQAAQADIDYTNAATQAKLAEMYSYGSDDESSTTTSTVSGVDANGSAFTATVDTLTGEPVKSDGSDFSYGDYIIYGNNVYYYAGDDYGWLSSSDWATLNSSNGGTATSGSAKNAVTDNGLTIDVGPNSLIEGSVIGKATQGYSDTATSTSNPVLADVGKTAGGTYAKDDPLFDCYTGTSSSKFNELKYACAGLSEEQYEDAKDLIKSKAVNADMSSIPGITAGKYSKLISSEPVSDRYSVSPANDVRGDGALTANGLTWYFRMYNEYYKNGATTENKASIKQALYNADLAGEIDNDDFAALCYVFDIKE